MASERAEQQFQMTDLRRPKAVEISIAEDGKTLWVNVDGRCALRISDIQALDITGLRHTLRRSNPLETEVAVLNLRRGEDDP